MEIKIFGKIFKVKFFENLERSDGGMGKVDPKIGIIYLCKNMPDLIIRETLLHEIIHIMDGELMLGLGEEKVGIISNILHGVLADNSLLDNKSLIQIQEAKEEKI